VEQRERLNRVLLHSIGIFKFDINLGNQWRNYGVKWVAKCQGHRAGGSPLGPPASELKTLKIYLSAEYNYLKNILFYHVSFI
jgi:hypothetical protein